MAVDSPMDAAIAGAANGIAIAATTPTMVFTALLMSIPITPS
jgi:hypothetical protein